MPSNVRQTRPTMRDEVFSNISKIIERDSKATTYKFALLRAVIDIVQANTPFITFQVNRVHFPTGLLIEKWLVYIFVSKYTKTASFFEHNREKTHDMDNDYKNCLI